MKPYISYPDWLFALISIPFLSMPACTDYEADFQSYELDYWEQYTTDDGLAGDTVKVVFIDSDERIWVGTGNNGISVFDGNNIQNYNTTNGLVNNSISAIAEDKANELIWIGTEGGLSVLNEQGNWESLSEINGNPFSVITLNTDANSNLWIGTIPFGLLRFTIDHGLVQFGDEECELCNYVNTIYQSSDGSLWFGTDGGLKRFEGDEFILYTTEDGLPNNSVLAIYEDSWDHLWIGTWLGSFVVFYDNLEFRGVPLLNGSILNYVTSFCEDNTGQIWIGSYNFGLFQFDGAANRTLNPIRDPGEIQVNDIGIDNSGDLWVATQSNGIWKYISL